MEFLTQALAGIGLFFFFVVMILAIFAVIFGVPGNWIIFGEAVIYALIVGFDGPIGWWNLLALLLMAGTAELIEFVLTAYGAKKYGGSNISMAGAVVGAIIGAVLMAGTPPVVGALLGALIGAFVGAFAVVYFTEKDLLKARQAGMGALVGKMGAVLFKGSITVAMAVATTVWIIA